MNNELLNEKIKELLEAIGCEKEIFQKLESFENIDLNILKNNIDILMNFKYTKLELSKIITENPNILYMYPERIENNIKELENILDEKSLVKHCIYSYAHILTDNIKEKLMVLEKYEIPKQIQKYIIVENPMILGLNKEKLEEQLKYIKDVTVDFKKFIAIIMHFPMLIGTNELDLIKIFN